MRKNILLALVLITGATFFTILTMQKQTPRSQVESKLTSHLEMGVVELLVNDMSRQRHFYQDLVGLAVLDESSNSAVLGYEDRPILKLVEDKNKPFPATRSAGLYHSATVFETRSALAHALLRILTDFPQLYTGSADHLVSEAFYFNDPEGNGVELYFDKDPTIWIWNNGQIEMDSVYIDVKEYILAHGQTSTTQAKKMGHVHLKVGSIAEAKRFYVEVLGFRITAEMPTALFVSDGQYHHHLGMNVWESNGAGQRQPTLGLSSFVMMLDKKSDLEKLEARLNKFGVDFKKNSDQIIVFDPWLNQLFFEVKE